MPETLARLSVDIVATRRLIADAQRTQDIAREAHCLARLAALYRLADVALEALDRSVSRARTTE